MIKGLEEMRALLASMTLADQLRVMACLGNLKSTVEKEGVIGIMAVALLGLMMQEEAKGFLGKEVSP